MSANFQESLIRELRLFFDPVVRATAAPGRVFDLVRIAGWDLEAALGAAAGQVVSSFQGLGVSVTEIEQLLLNPPQTLGDLPKALETVGSTVADVRQLSTLGPAPAEWAEFPADLFDALAVLYIGRRSPPAYNVLSFLEVIHPVNRPALVFNSRLVRPGGLRPTLDLDRIGALLTDPVGELKQIYLPNGLATQADADVAAEKLFPPLAALLSVTGAEPMLGLGQSPPPLAPPLDEAFRRLLSFVYRVALDDGDELEIGATLALIGGDNGGPGVYLGPFGGVTLVRDLDSWRLTLDVGAGVPGVLIAKGDLEFVGGATAVRLDLGVQLEKLGGSGPDFLVGSATGTRLEIGEFKTSGSGSFSLAEQRFGFLLEVGHATVKVTPGDGDGFLQKVLPPDGLTAKFDLAVGWSNTKGIYFRGSAGLEATIPVHVSLLGIVTVDSVFVAVRTDGGDLVLVLAATGSIALGPILASVQRVGLTGRLTFPQGGGNLGPAHLDRFGFKSPDGASLAIDAGPVTGGGFLFYDEKQAQYAGGLHLSFQSISLTAIGLLTTKMPDGSPGFSLLIIIVAEFPPIQLGFGFTLNGAGGLLGVNRTVVVEALRTGIKNRTLDSILFPKDPERNALQIVSNLSTVFPPAPRRYVFGPMAKIGWGTPMVLTVEIGIALELPSPIRLIIMGRLTLVMPEASAAVLVIKMDVLGIVDFDRGEASVDATIYDSRVARFTITGDMAMRANWAQSPTFALSAGGFNPRFTPPPNFPALRRMTIALADGDNPRVRLEAYFALTSNTFQVGARLEVFASTDLGFVGKFTVEAYLGFDALFQFDPFSFIVDVGGGASLKRNGQHLFGVELEMTLSGPEPWHAWGKAKFKLGWFASYSIGFDLTIGNDPPPAALPTANPLPELEKAVRDVGNWSAQLPSSGTMLVTLRDVSSGPRVLAHPLGRLTVRQRIVPLNVEIARFGNAVPSAARRFTLTVEIGGRAPQPSAEAVKDLFAAAQFFELSDDEKLSRPSFEPFEAGLSFGPAGTAHGSTTVADYDYETRIIDLQRRTISPGGPYILDPEIAVALAELGAAAFSPAAAAGPGKYRGEKLDIRVKEPSYVVASEDDLVVLGADGAGSYTEALQRRRDLFREARGVQVVRDYEAVAP